MPSTRSSTVATLNPILQHDIAFISPVWKKICLSLDLWESIYKRVLYKQTVCVGPELAIAYALLA